MLEDDTDFVEADIFIAPPDGGEGNDTDKDSADEDGGIIDNLTGKQLRSEASATVRRTNGRDIVETPQAELRDTTNSSDSSSGDEQISDSSSVDSDDTVDYEVQLPVHQFVQNWSPYKEVVVATLCFLA